jgi:hypothetical protein
MDNVVEIILVVIGFVTMMLLLILVGAVRELAELFRFLIHGADRKKDNGE